MEKHERIIWIGLGIFLLIVIGVVTYIEISKPEFKVYQQNCNLSLEKPTCSDRIEVEGIEVGNVTISKHQLSQELLTNACKVLNNNTWACNGYLITYG